MVDFSYVLVTFVIVLVFYLFVRKEKKEISLVDIIVYPVKSCAGLHLAKAEISELGIKDDRKWAIFLECKSISQLEEPKMLHLQPSFKYDSHSVQTHLVLSFTGFADCVIPLNEETSSPKDFILEEANGQFIDQGDKAAAWLTEVFGKNYRLGRLCTPRVIGKIAEFAGKSFAVQELSFASEGQVLIVSQESLEELTESVPVHVRKKLNFDCFRPNLIVKNCPMYSEDHWGKFLINNVFFEGIKKCDRCRMTTINQQTDEFDKDCEPLNTLRKKHGNGTKGFFGLLAVRLNNGLIRIGDKIRVNSKVTRD